MTDHTSQDGSSKYVVGSTDDVSEGSPLVADVDGTEIAIFYENGEYYALNNVCPHQGGPLGEGKVEGKGVYCPWHGWQFDLESGKHVHGSDVIETYSIMIDDGNIYVEL